MKKSVVLGKASVLCPCCGYGIIVDATVRLKGEPKVQNRIEDKHPTAEADSDG